MFSRTMAVPLESAVVLVDAVASAREVKKLGDKAGRAARRRGVRRDMVVMEVDGGGGEERIAGTEVNRRELTRVL